MKASSITDSFDNLNHQQNKNFQKKVKTQVESKTSTGEQISPNSPPNQNPVSQETIKTTAEVLTAGLAAETARYTKNKDEREKLAKIKEKAESGDITPDLFVKELATMKMPDEEILANLSSTARDFMGKKTLLAGKSEKSIKLWEPFVDAYKEYSIETERVGKYQVVIDSHLKLKENQSSNKSLTMRGGWQEKNESFLFANEKNIRHSIVPNQNINLHKNLDPAFFTPSSFFFFLLKFLLFCLLALSFCKSLKEKLYESLAKESSAPCYKDSLQHLLYTAYI